MNDFKIVFLDIDGTILKPDDTIEESTKSAVKQLQQKGIEVVLATGRPLHEISDIGEELNIHSFIGYNGSYASYKEEEIVSEPMSRSSVEKMIKLAKAKGHELVMFSNGTNWLTSLEAPKMVQFLEKFHLHKNKLVEPQATSIILGMTIIVTDDTNPDEYIVEEDIHLSPVNVEGMTHCYDVIRKKANKGIGVKKMLKRLGIPKENSIAFGDGWNDKEMLSEVGVGFAMENAHPDLKQYADRVTTSVNDSGIFNGLKKLGLVE